MLVNYNFHNKKLNLHPEKSADLGALLTNGLGGFYYFRNKPASKYQGWFLGFGPEVWRIIENLEVKGAGSFRGWEYNFHSFKALYSRQKANFIFPKGRNSLLLELNKPGEVEVFLDPRRIFETDSFGRHFQMIPLKRALLVSYSKGSERLYIAIRGDSPIFHKKASWIKRIYGVDQKRNDPDFERYVFDLGVVSGKRFVFSASLDRREALEECEDAFLNFDKIFNRNKAIFASLPFGFKRRPRKEDWAVFLAKVALFNLILKTENSYAVYSGLPWFVQEWARDSLFCLPQIFKLFPEVGEAVFRDIARAAGGAASADKRIVVSDDSPEMLLWAFAELRKKKMEPAHFRKDFLAVLEKLLQERTQDNLALLAPDKTWMDSVRRSCFPIEVQALRIRAYRLARLLTRRRKYELLEKKLLEAVRKDFSDGRRIFDGRQAKETRPNIFLAYFFCPWMFERKIWLAGFDEAIQKLWLDWGGFATLDRNDPRFVSRSTGQNPASYHNGDSWFFLNNIAALAMRRLAPSRYRRYIVKIRAASRNDILLGQVLGGVSELSSAEKFSPAGSVLQAWSAASFLKLLNF